MLFHFHRFVEALLDTELIEPVLGIFGHLFNALLNTELCTSIFETLSGILFLSELSCKLSCTKKCSHDILFLCVVKKNYLV